MDILYLLIPLSLVLVLGIVAVFGWAVHSGQFDDLEGEGERLLQDDVTDEGRSLDLGQVPGDVALQQFRDGSGRPVHGPARAR